VRLLAELTGMILRRPEVRIALPVIDRVLWQNVNLSYDERGIPILTDFDFDTACRNRELRNAAWEIYDLVRDWESATKRTAELVDELDARLDRHLAAHGVGVVP
jgi:hypothetical protein